MTQTETAAIDKQAREMRAAEIRRLCVAFAKGVGYYSRMLGDRLGETLRPLLSWNSQEFRHHFTDAHHPL